MKRAASIQLTAFLLAAASVTLCPSHLMFAQTVGNRSELPKMYEQWLDEDVRWIITSEERTAFRALSNDDDRDRFIERFWQRRDPTPGTPENEFKEEHYRRIAYANMHFGWDKVPGWETDRGRIYIEFGPPDATTKPRTLRVKAPSGVTREMWYYNFIRKDTSMKVSFVDYCACGDYRLEQVPSD